MQMCRSGPDAHLTAWSALWLSHTASGFNGHASIVSFHVEQARCDRALMTLLQRVQGLKDRVTGNHSAISVSYAGDQPG
eukprot:3242963-Pleurochrysis_carterae.AAC.1